MPTDNVIAKYNAQEGVMKKLARDSKQCQKHDPALLNLAKMDNGSYFKKIVESHKIMHFALYDHTVTSHTLLPPCKSTGLLHDRRKCHVRVSLPATSGRTAERALDLLYRSCSIQAAVPLAKDDYYSMYCLGLHGRCASATLSRICADADISCGTLLRYCPRPRSCATATISRLLSREPWSKVRG